MPLCPARRILRYRRNPFRPNPSRPRRPPVVDQSDLDAVARQLGREPRGVLEIAYRCPNGEPAVVKTAPRLPDGTPFPTLYYLTHPALTAAASRLESEGVMRVMTDRLQSDPDAAATYRRAHESYLAERDAVEPLADGELAGADLDHDALLVRAQRLAVPLGAVSTQVRGSAVLGTIDTVMPQAPRDW